MSRVGVSSYYAGKSLPLQNKLDQMKLATTGIELQNLKDQEWMENAFAADPDFWNAVSESPPSLGLVGPDDQNPALVPISPIPKVPVGKYSYAQESATSAINEPTTTFGGDQRFDKPPVPSVSSGLVTPNVPNTVSVNPQTAKTSAEKADNMITNRMGKVNDIATDLISGKLGVFAQNVNLIHRYALEMGVDPAAALAIAGIESDFGSSRSKHQGYNNPLQITDATKNLMVDFFRGKKFKKERDRLVSTGVISADEMEKLSDIAAKIRGRGWNRKETNIRAGLLRLKYNELIGVDKDLWGAAYFGNAEKVRDGGLRGVKDKNNLYDYDYNRVFTTFYNQFTQLGIQSGMQPVTVATGLQGPGGRSGQINAGTPQSIVATPPGGRHGQIGTNTQTSQTSPQSGLLISPEAVAAKGKGPDAPPVSAGVQTDKEDKEVKKYPRYKPDPKVFTIDKKTLENPAKIGPEIQRLIAKRGQVYRLAQIARLGGNPEGALKAVGELSAIDDQIWLAQGYQGIRDLEYGDTLRASRVWSHYLTGGNDMDRIQVRMRSDGNYNVYDNGKLLHDNLTLDEVSTRASLVFDKGAREALKTSKASMSTKIFESRLKIQEKTAEIIANTKKDLDVESVKALNNIQLKKLEKELELELKRALGEDVAVTPAGDGRYIFIRKGRDTYTLDLQGDEAEFDGNMVPVPSSPEKLTYQSSGNAPTTSWGSIWGSS